MVKAQSKKSSEQNKSYEFQAEVSRLLDIVANSLYSDRDVFLRELISNASDACDKRRYESLKDETIALDNADYKIKLIPNLENRTLTIQDPGIGMDEQELIDNLGTIAKSGTAIFASEKLKKDKNKEDVVEAETTDVNDHTDLIGQFGVGFYSAFMVADRVEVLTKKAEAGNEKAYLWSCSGYASGESGFSIEEASKESFGTEITLYLKEGMDEFLERSKLGDIVLRYSDHIDFPILIVKEDGEEEKLNEGTALWAKSKSDITDEQYQEFYRHVGGGFDIPLTHFHWRVEGALDYTGLLYIPSMRPYDLFDPKRPHGVKLYVKKVYITDQCEGLVPPWLRFLRGVIDSQDLPLNISREMLQTNPMVAKISSLVTKKILGELEKMKKNDEPIYLNFWKNFGSILKEGLYEMGPHRDRILGLSLFNTTKDLGHTSLDDYVENMKEGQSEIYYLQGDNLEAMKQSPQLEAFLDKGIEVLLFDHMIDNFWVNTVSEYKGFTLKSITKEDVDFDSLQDDGDQDKTDDGTDKSDQKNDDFIKSLENVLKPDVAKVQASKRLTSSPVCLVAARGDADLKMEKVMQSYQEASVSSKRVLEVNLNHPLLKKLSSLSEDKDKKEIFESLTKLLYDQARLLEGDLPEDVSSFSKRLNDLLIQL